MTSVHPLRPFGHSIRRRRVERGAVLVVRVVAVGTVAAEGEVDVGAVAPVVGSGDVSPTSVSLAALPASRVQTIAAAVAAIAIRSASSEGQIQSPGYQRTRRRQPSASAGTSPGVWSRKPHSRQYSCRG